jgi:hypothetical protein
MILQDLQLKAVSKTTGDDSSAFSLTDIWEETRIALDRLSFTAGSYYNACIGSPASLERLSLFSIYGAYQTAMMLIKLGRGKPDELTQRRIKNAKRLLLRLDRNWKVAGGFNTLLFPHPRHASNPVNLGVYLSVIEAQEATYDPVS